MKDQHSSSNFSLRKEKVTPDRRIGSTEHEIRQAKDDGLGSPSQRSSAGWGDCFFPSRCSAKGSCRACPDDSLQGSLPSAEVVLLALLGERRPQHSGCGRFAPWDYSEEDTSILH